MAPEGIKWSSHVCTEYVWEVFTYSKDWGIIGGVCERSLKCTCFRIFNGGSA